MAEKFKRIEKQLYERTYKTAAGEWITLYYGNFVDWKGKRRWFPLGDNRKKAREEDPGRGGHARGRSQLGSDAPGVRPLAEQRHCKSVRD